MLYGSVWCYEPLASQSIRLLIKNTPTQPLNLPPIIKYSIRVGYTIYGAGKKNQYTSRLWPTFNMYISFFSPIHIK